MKETKDVFGVSNNILYDSYVDRGDLDEKIQRLLNRSTHIALRGESKCGKSWLRQKNIPNAITVQCRHGRSVIDLYTNALSQLDIKLTVEEKSDSGLQGHIEAQSHLGANLLAKIGLVASVTGSESTETKQTVIGKDINDLQYIADIIKTSNRRLVIEDFHYLSLKEREQLAFDLKTLCILGCFSCAI